MKPPRFSTLLNEDLESARRDARAPKDRDALSREITRLRLRVLELERDANTDPLVSVYNRRAFMREISKAQSVVQRYDIPSSVIFIDLDGFKKINDRFGHAIGDTLLQRIGEALQSNVRDCDMVARLGGDEFGILLFKTTIEIAQAKAAVLMCRIAEQYVEMPAMKIQISASSGVAPCDPNDTPEQILDRADRAMFMMKR